MTIIAADANVAALTQARSTNLIINVGKFTKQQLMERVPTSVRTGQLRVITVVSEPQDVL
jgi:hypothetical protein